MAQLRPGTQTQLVLTITGKLTRVTKPCLSIGGAKALNHKPVATPTPHFLFYYSLKGAPPNMLGHFLLF